MSDDLLRLEGVSKRYPVQRGALRRTTGWVRAVDDLSLAIPGGRRSAWSARAAAARPRSPASS